ncbi:MAG TPA: class I SAM-dependent rRNA methyltransferase [Xanthomonadales bacterium]|nr:class I SAM-dependent rRNA methyltransferase [Xanthomonadales bacterium]
MELPALALKKGEDARLRAGHAWIFSNEVDTRRTPLTAFEPGQHAVVVDHADKPIGIAYVNPNALICARLVVRGIKHEVDRSLFVHRLKVALGLREQLYQRPWYRLVYGEADGLPGLVLDRYDEVVVGQIATVGMEAMKREVEAAVQKVLKPAAMVWKNAGSLRQLEGLPEYVETAFGELPERVIAEEGGLEFEIDVEHGQKTGWFYDQRANRDQMAPYVAGGRVLDLFAYVGAWGVRAASFGAREVVCVDASKKAVEAIRANAFANRVGARVTALEEDVFDALKRLRHEKERFDTVIVDPPAFVKRKKDFAEGKLAYRRINEAAMQLLGKDGILITCSCSWHMSREVFLEVINAGARHLDRNVQVLSRLQQAPDHPVNPAIPETDYLKGFVCRVVM